MLTVDFDYFDLQPGHICVDLGCGEGRHSLTAYMAEGVTVLGFDLAYSDLKTAKSRISDMEPHNPAGDVSFVQANGMSLPLADNSVDRLICSEVLEHIPNYISFIEEIDRVLKPDGKLCITVPRAWPEKICWLLSDEYQKHLVVTFGSSMLSIFSVRSSATILRAHGVTARMHCTRLIGG